MKKAANFVVLQNFFLVPKKDFHLKAGNFITTPIYLSHFFCTQGQAVLESIPAVLGSHPG